jgi:hypothetical protein
VLKQGPVTRRKAREPEPALGEEDRSRVEAAAAKVEEEPLRAALERLGTAVAREAARHNRTKA